MIKINFSITPTIEELKQWVEGWEKEAIKDLTPYWDKYASRLVAEEIARVFVTEGYGTWAPLSYQYALAKAINYPGKTILRRKDRYFKASTRKAAPGNIYDRDANKMTWGADLSWFAGAYDYPYPIAHEEGRGNLPPRPVYALAEKSQALKDNLIVGLKTYIHKTIANETKKYFGKR